MRRILHHELGEPARVLRVEDGPSTSLGPDQVRVRLSYAPIHPGDLLGIMGSQAFGTPPTITSDWRVPGFEGADLAHDAGAFESWYPPIGGDCRRRSERLRAHD